MYDLIYSMEEELKRALSAHNKKHITCASRIQSAVLVPLFDKGGECHMLFTQRSNKVAYHKGQISFPGGAHSEADSGLLDTALRESWEEIGLKPEDAIVVGELDDIPTATSVFIISPFVAIIPYPYIFTPNPNEIVDIFDVPISALMDKANFRQEYTISEDEPSSAYVYEYDGRVIWGATARIVKQFLDIIR
jgi:8-oxo-dGTP pyrophosphatase MutT (NUDIX family)